MHIELVLRYPNLRHSYERIINPGVGTENQYWCGNVPTV